MASLRFILNIDDLFAEASVVSLNGVQCVTYDGTKALDAALHAADLADRISLQFKVAVYIDTFFIAILISPLRNILLSIFLT